MNCLAAACIFFSQSLAVCAEQLTTGPDSSSPTRPIRDIRMQDGGWVMFDVLDAGGHALPHRTVTIAYQGHVVATARSNNGGQIRVSGLRSGIHLLASGQSSVPLRLWSADVAPPFATDSTAIVVSQPIVRGQYGPPMVGPGMLATGAGIAGLVVVLAGKSASSDSVPVPPAGTLSSVESGDAAGFDPSSSDSTAGPASP